MVLSKAQLRKLASVGIVDDPKYPQAIKLEGGMDPEVVDVVVALNRAGYKTLETCAGHSGKHGLIIFNMWIGKHLQKILSIMKSHGLEISSYDLSWKPVIWFESIGKSEEQSNKKKREYYLKQMADYRKHNAGEVLSKYIKDSLLRDRKRGIEWYVKRNGIWFTIISDRPKSKEKAMETVNSFHKEEHLKSFTKQAPDGRWLIYKEMLEPVPANWK